MASIDDHEQDVEEPENSDDSKERKNQNKSLITEQLDTSKASKQQEDQIKRANIEQPEASNATKQQGNHNKTEINIELSIQQPETTEASTKEGIQHESLKVDQTGIGQISTLDLKTLTTEQPGTSNVSIHGEEHHHKSQKEVLDRWKNLLSSPVADRSSGHPEHGSPQHSSELKSVKIVGSPDYDSSSYSPKHSSELKSVKIVGSPDYDSVSYSPKHGGDLSTKLQNDSISISSSQTKESPSRDGSCGSDIKISPFTGLSSSIDGKTQQHSKKEDSPQRESSDTNTKNRYFPGFYKEKETSPRSADSSTTHNPPNKIIKTENKTKDDKTDKPKQEESKPKVKWNFDNLVQNNSEVTKQKFDYNRTPVYGILKSPKPTETKAHRQLNIEKGLDNKSLNKENFDQPKNYPMSPRRENLMVKHSYRNEPLEKSTPRTSKTTVDSRSNEYLTNQATYTPNLSPTINQQNYLQPNQYYNSNTDLPYPMYQSDYPQDPATLYQTQQQPRFDANAQFVSGSQYRNQQPMSLRNFESPLYHQPPSSPNQMASLPPPHRDAHSPRFDNRHENISSYLSSPPFQQPYGHNSHGRIQTPYGYHSQYDASQSPSFPRFHHEQQHQLLSHQMQDQNRFQMTQQFGNDPNTSKFSNISRETYSPNMHSSPKTFENQEQILAYIDGMNDLQYQPGTQNPGHSPRQSATQPHQVAEQGYASKGPDQTSSIRNISLLTINDQRSPEQPNVSSGYQIIIVPNGLLAQQSGQLVTESSIETTQLKLQHNENTTIKDSETINITDKQLHNSSCIANSHHMEQEHEKSHENTDRKNRKRKSNTTSTSNDAKKTKSIDICRKSQAIEQQERVKCVQLDFIASPAVLFTPEYLKTRKPTHELLYCKTKPIQTTSKAKSLVHSMIKGRAENVEKYRKGYKKTLLEKYRYNCESPIREQTKPKDLQQDNGGIPTTQLQGQIQCSDRKRNDKALNEKATEPKELPKEESTNKDCSGPSDIAVPLRKDTRNIKVHSAGKEKTISLKKPSKFDNNVTKTIDQSLYCSGLKLEKEFHKRRHLDDADIAQLKADLEVSSDSENNQENIIAKSGNKETKLVIKDPVLNARNSIEGDYENPILCQEVTLSQIRLDLELSDDSSHDATETGCQDLGNKNIKETHQEKDQEKDSCFVQEYNALNIHSNSSSQSESSVNKLTANVMLRKRNISMEKQEDSLDSFEKDFGHSAATLSAKLKRKQTNRNFILDKYFASIDQIEIDEETLEPYRSCNVSEEEMSVDESTDEIKDENGIQNKNNHTELTNKLPCDKKLEFKSTIDKSNEEDQIKIPMKQAVKETFKDQREKCVKSKHINISRENSSTSIEADSVIKEIDNMIEIIEYTLGRKEGQSPCKLEF